MVGSPQSFWQWVGFGPSRLECLEKVTRRRGWLMGRCLWTQTLPRPGPITSWIKGGSGTWSGPRTACSSNQRSLRRAQLARRRGRRGLPSPPSCATAGASAGSGQCGEFCCRPTFGFLLVDEMIRELWVVLEWESAGGLNDGAEWHYIMLGTIGVPFVT